jgi:hypothetical protein
LTFLISVANIVSLTHINEAKMNAPLRAPTLPLPAQAAFAQIPEVSKAQAERLGIQLLWNEDGFGLYAQMDMLAEKLNAHEVQVWLDGFDCCGNSDSIPADLLAELVAAEQIIQTLSAQMTDAQRLAASESLVSVGFPADGAARCQPRRAAIAEARKRAFIQQ